MAELRQVMGGIWRWPLAALASLLCQQAVPSPVDGRSSSRGCSLAQNSRARQFDQLKQDSSRIARKPQEWTNGQADETSGT